MSRDLIQTERDTLEALIDASSVSAVIEALSGICGEKADQIASNGGPGDAALARHWRTAEGHIGCVVASLPRQPGIV